METVPGTAIIGGSRRIAEEPSIRGFADEQVVIRIDGARQNFDLAHRGRFFIDPELVQRAEVIRGGASALYGSGALGGVISLDTLGARNLLAPGEAFGAMTRLGYQSNGEETSFSGTVFGAGERIDALASVVRRRVGEDLEDGNGDAILDTRDRVTSALLRLGVAPGQNQRLELVANRFESRGDNPTNATSTSTPTTVVGRDTRQHDLRLRYRLTPTEQRWLDLTAVAYTSRVDTTEARRFDGRIDDSDFESRGLDVYNTSRLDLGGSVDVAVTYGLELFQDSQSGLRDGAPRPQFPDAERRFTALYLQAELNLGERWSLIPGLRYDRFSLEETGGDTRDETRLTPRVALGWQPVDTVYTWVSYGEAFRAPSLTQLYNQGVHFAVPNALGPGTVVVNEFVPNLQLRPEEAATYEAGVRLRFDGLAGANDRLTITGTAFRSNIDDYVEQTVVFIDRSRAPVFTPPFGPTTFFGATANRNVEARLQGFEAELQYRRAGLTALLTATLLDGSRRDIEAPLGSIPQDRFTAQMTGQWPGSTLTLGGRVSHATARDDVPEGSVTGEAFTTVDMFAEWAPTAGLLRNTRITLGLDNLLDETFSVYPTLINQPGRSVRLSFAYRMQP
jgi:hemoglobin/transferrin/lactoferrin receptor protein